MDPEERGGLVVGGRVEDVVDPEERGGLVVGGRVEEVVGALVVAG